MPDDTSPARPFPAGPWQQRRASSVLSARTASRGGSSGYGGEYEDAVVQRRLSEYSDDKTKSKSKGWFGSMFRDPSRSGVATREEVSPFRGPRPRTSRVALANAEAQRQQRAQRQESSGWGWLLGGGRGESPAPSNGAAHPAVSNGSSLEGGGVSAAVLRMKSPDWVMRSSHNQSSRADPVQPPLPPPKQPAGPDKRGSGRWLDMEGLEGILFGGGGKANHDGESGGGGGGGDDHHHHHRDAVVQAASVPAEPHDAAERRRLTARLVKTFNSAGARRGVAELKTSGLLQRTDAKAVAGWLSSTQSVDKALLGEWLGEPDNLAVDTLVEIARAARLGGRSLYTGLRVFMLSFDLPGESQKIDRILEVFAVAYQEANPKAYVSADLVHLLAFAAIMLHTDAHNTAIAKQKKMTKEQFVKNLRRVPGGHSLGEAELEALFDAVLSQPLRAQSIEFKKTSREAAAANPLFGNKPPLRQGWLQKTGKKRWFALTRDKGATTLYYFASPRDPSPRGFVPLLAAPQAGVAPRAAVSVLCAIGERKRIDILPAPGGESLRVAKYGSRGELVWKKPRTFWLRAPSDAEAAEWVAALQDAIASAVAPGRKV